MKFYSNSISTGESISFEDFAAKVLGQSEEKTASEKSVVKTASTKVAETEEVAEEKAPEVEETEEVEASEESDKEVTEASKKEKEEADGSGQLEVEPLHQEGESTPVVGKKKEEASATSETKVAGDCCDKDNENNDDADSSGQAEWEGKQENVNDPEAGKHRDGEGDQKEASTGTKFEKVANLDEKSKAWLSEYWRNIYPEAYVEAMLADK